MTTLSIVFTNNSTNNWDACVFQQDRDENPQGVYSLAWFVKRCHPQTRVQFSWDVNHSFVWAETGLLKPGVQFQAAQEVQANLNAQNAINFDEKDGAFLFSGQGSANPANSLYINQGRNIPLNTASVGVGMSGAGTFAIQAQPNIKAVFSPNVSYWMVFGDFRQGEVLDIAQMTNSNPSANAIKQMTSIVEVYFPPGVFNVSVTLNQDNTWTVVPA